mmetsp:Transcript_25597/g.39653  ORF Transcript_25597/g.39653 Transcript_25597/m.39653 type:complete len:417 (+) Transcript_25597:183-1433(+)|eukprot:CAMPEP_0196826624 /NCGR_PEP_ID=MMETSP1362-20130617/93719_1 /TAXON_ID=163516 /ORGANISM="Leptocylindrus danicus, Strain CCMP1856" /LENGTH=416 /DNA_ID=CAMNT_0042207203 /DNA_START=1348 /DNA_END=2598 /DNA_ORIENTATION=-
MNKLHQQEDSLIASYQWVVLLISCAEEEVRGSVHHAASVNGDEVLKALKELIYILSKSFSTTQQYAYRNNNECAGTRNINNKLSPAALRYFRSQTKHAEMAIIHALTMIRLLFAESKVNEFHVELVALLELSLVLEYVLREWHVINAALETYEADLATSDGSEAEGKEDSQYQWSKRADAAVLFLASSAEAVEIGLAKYAVPSINEGLDIAKGYVKENIIQPVPPEEQPQVPKSVLGATAIAKEASTKAHEASKDIFTGVGSVATEAVNRTASQIDKISAEQHDVYKGNRDALGAAGRVALASVGAIATISEAVFETSVAVTNKVANVTADVIGHRYGEESGQVVANSADTLANTARAIKFATSLTRVSRHAESVARNNGKAELEKKNSKSARMNDRLNSEDVRNALSSDPVIIDV